VHRLLPEERGRWIERVGETIGTVPTPSQMRLFQDPKA
jgi:hypothetical protein